MDTTNRKENSNINKQSIDDYIQREIENSKQKEINNRIKLQNQHEKDNKNQNKNNEIIVNDPELQNYYMEYNYYDYIYPFCLFFQSKEKIPYTDIYFRINSRYMHKLR